MRKRLFAGLAMALFVFGMTGTANAVIIDFNGGTAFLADGTSVTVTDSDLYWDVDYYVEDGMKIDFVGGTGIIGNYYNDAMLPPDFVADTPANGVIHAHWEELDQIVFSKVDGSEFDLNYVDLSSNTENGGYEATGAELSYIVSDSGYSELLPTSDWGIDHLFSGEVGDGVERLWIGEEFDNIEFFTITSSNAYCFGLDNFYIDEAAPTPSHTPEPATLFLLTSGIAGFAGLRRRRKK